MVLTVLFWISVAAIIWLGLRHLISAIRGIAQLGPVKPGQRLCHLTSTGLYWSAALVAILINSWWPLPIGFIAELLFRRLVIWAGAKACEKETDLLIAIRSRDIELLEYLVQEGGDVNWQYRTADGGTALHEAARYGNSQATEFLLQNGARVNTRTFKGVTPLHVAAYCGENKVAEALLDADAEVNSVASDNVTPLHAAALMGHCETLELLINRGSLVDARNSRDGSTPLDIALREGHEGAAKILQQALHKNN